MTENLVIIGSGPAGYTAAIYAARANLQPLVITGFKKGGIAGGQLMTTTLVENFPGFPDGVLGPELMDRIKAQAIRWGTKLIEEDAEGIDLLNRPFTIKTDQKLITAHSVIIATGASANRLDLPNEKLFWTRGISACAICDGATPQFRNTELAVVGGGDSACEEAEYLTKYGSHVHILVRSNKFKASAAMADRVIANTMITIHWNTLLIGLEGDHWLNSIKLKDIKTNKERNLSVKGLFYAIGHTPNTDLVANQLQTNSKGYLITKQGRPETSIEGVFSAGDVADSEWRQGITAASSGCKAALVAERWLSKNNLSRLIEREELNPSIAQKKLDLVTSTKENYNSNALLQKGSYALRRLYHESKRPLLVIYTSANCGPCYILKPQIKRLLEEFEGSVQGVEIDIEIDQKIAEQAEIAGTPTIHLFKDKILIQKWSGVKQRSVFREAIKNILNS